jgi:hypothetical protein
MQACSISVTHFCAMHKIRFPPVVIAAVSIDVRLCSFIQVDDVGDARRRSIKRYLELLEVGKTHTCAECIVGDDGVCET